MCEVQLSVADFCNIDQQLSAINRCYHFSMLKEEVGQRIKARRLQLGMNQADVAERLGVKSSSAISQWERGVNMPDGVHLYELGRVLGVSTEWILSGGGGGDIDDITTFVTRKVPLISETQAGAWREIVDNFEPGDAEEWIPAIKKMSKYAFALRLHGTSMMNPNDKRSIPDGAIIFVDPDVTINNGDIVLARLSTEASTCKKLMIDGEQTYLVPLNPDFKPILMTPDMNIVGVVISAQVAL